MKRISHLLTIALSFCAFALNAATWTDETTGITWRYEEYGDGVAPTGAWNYYYDGGVEVRVYTASIPQSTSGEIIIPSYINSKPVTAVGDYAFRDCSRITSIVIPDGVTSIGSEAFYGCSNLTTVVIPEGVTTIGPNAFKGSSNLKELTILGEGVQIAEGAFAYCSSLQTICLPAKCTITAKYVSQAYDPNKGG